MKKKRWRKIVLSFLPILIVVIGLVFVSGVLMPGQREASRKRQRCAAAGRRNRNDMAAAERIFHRGG